MTTEYHDYPVHLSRCSIDQKEEVSIDVLHLLQFSFRSAAIH